jgi:hypothetical protein
MTIRSVWRRRLVSRVVCLSKPRLKSSLKSKRKRYGLTDLCVCGHPYVSHLKIDGTGIVGSKPCACSCAEYRKAKRTVPRKKAS